MKDANATMMRARLFRERRRRGVVGIAAIEVMASDIPVLVGRGLLKPDCTTNKAALEDAVTSAFEQWLKQRVMKSRFPDQQAYLAALHGVYSQATRRQRPG